MTTVIIDGIEYIPARNVLANENQIARGLLDQFWGVCTDDVLKDLINDNGIKVVVHDGYGEGGVSLRKVLDTIAKQENK